MGKKKTKNKRNSELKVIFFIILVAAALFIISTYAWFTTQKNVSITNLEGIVEVAEGLEISLDGETWANEIVLGDDVNIIDSAYTGHRNISPVEMLPVSTTGVLNGTNLTDLTMLRGKVTNSTFLDEIVATDEKLALSPDQETHNSADAKYPGYFAFDIFLKNSSKQTDSPDELQLNYDSSVQIITDGNDTVGLQNTVRVALARYGSTYNAADRSWKGVADVMAKQPEVLLNTGISNNNEAEVYLTDVAIWEPNSNDHVEYIINNNNNVTWSIADAKTYFNQTVNQPTAINFTMTTQMPTYVLTETSVGKTIGNIYYWDTNNSYTIKNDNTTYSNKNLISKQNTLQTTNKKSATANEDGSYDVESYNINEGVQYLFSAADPTQRFTLAPNKITRFRVYVWLEGQDVDCINYASYGGGITVNLGLVKGATVGSKGEAEGQVE